MSATDAPQLVDGQNPWIGLASFHESDREFFAGRGEEVEQLLRLVRRDSLTLLYGVSGLGKTSLLQAGLFPALRKEDFLPVAVRLDFQEDAIPLADQVLGAIGAAASKAGVDAPTPLPNESLWEFFHRQENHFWSARNDLVTIFLAFDQFEEFFTLGRENGERASRGRDFIIELADLVENRPPAELRDDPIRAKEFSFKAAPVNVLLSMREDYLGDLDSIRARFRALVQNRMRLRPMGEQQALEVIALGASLIAPGVDGRIVNYVAGAGETNEAAELNIAPALLSLVLRQLNEKRPKPDGKITLDLLDLEQEKILEEFYVTTLARYPTGVRTFVEDKLLTATGHRSSCALEDAIRQPNVTEKTLDELVDRRLLAYEDRHRTKQVELTHDVLLPAIKASRDARLREKQAALRLRQHLTTAAAVALFLTLIATIWGGYYAFLQEHRAYYRSFSKRNGFPEGIDPISEAFARKLPVSFQLVHKGMTRSGWKPRWKPPFRMIAYNGDLEPTTRHNQPTYLWRGEIEADTTKGTRPDEKGQRLGLQNVCQWEFIATGKGEILYERGLDREGRMMYGLIYSPRDSKMPDTRLARYVGADGFPQLQRQTAAEYVELHYDKDGWEDKVTYRDGKNLPAAGPFGAFGSEIRHNSRGQQTRLLSIDAEGKTMIDDEGNTGMETIYDQNGYATEERSLGPDLKPMPVKQGWYVSQTQFDDLGRQRSITFFDAEGRRILTKAGYHGWASTYDGHGNQTRCTFLGLDGKPTLFADGYASWKSDYDTHGRMVRMSFEGVNGEAVGHKDGNYAWEAEFDARGNQSGLTFLGADAKPATIVEGFASSKSKFDASGRLTGTSYFGPKGEPVLNRQGYHSWTGKYDERGNQTEGAYYGLDGKLTVLAGGFAVYRRKYDSDGNELEASYYDARKRPTFFWTEGYHRVRRVYDARGKITRVSHIGPNGKPALHKDGYHLWEAEYDRRGNCTSISYLGRDGKFIIASEGYATMKADYDYRGKKIRELYFGANGDPVLNKDGYHGWSAVYDERGNMIEKSYFGVDQRPTWRMEGYSKVVSVFDLRGNELRQSYYGVNGEPVLHQESYHGWEVTYDDLGRKSAVTYFGLNDLPVLVNQYATQKSEYDALGYCLQQTYLGVKGEPVLHKDGYHGWRAEYDRSGHETARSYFGLKGEPVIWAEGFSSAKYTYNSCGLVIRGEYYGRAGEPVLHKEGYHAYSAVYDDRGWQTSISYFDREGAPALLPDNYSSIHYAYESRGKLIRTSYHGVKGEPVGYKKGYHALQNTYDDHGNDISVGYLDFNWNPTPVSEEVAIMRSRFDCFGNTIEITTHGVNGEPVSFESGVQRLETTRDAYGRMIAERWYDKEGHPARPAGGGVNAFVYTYDERGLRLTKTARDANNQPMVNKFGLCQEVSEYNDRRQLTKSQFFGLNHVPAENPDGDHLVLNLFDERWRELRETRLRATGAPNWNRDLGVASLVKAYDNQGRESEFAYHDEHDRLVVGPGGYARWTLAVQESGDEERTYRGTDDKPVFDPLVGYAIQKIGRARKGETTESFYGADAAPIDGPQGYAEARRQWAEDGTMLQEAFFGAAGEPVPGPAGYHRMERTPNDASAVTYLNVDKTPLHSLGSDELASLIMVGSIENLRRPAARAGLRAGDILWRYGTWSMIDVWERARQTMNQPGDIAEEMRQTFLAERDRLSESAVPMTVVRENQVLMLFMPPLPEKTAGMVIQSRHLPLDWFEKLKVIAGTPPVPTKAPPAPVPKPTTGKKNANR